MTVIRPMQLADVEACERVWHHAWNASRRSLHLPGVDVDRVRVDRMVTRLRHLLGTDPGGSYVAEEEGQVVGLAQSLIRGRVWVLSLFGVTPEAQGQGAGRRLLAAAVGYGPDLPGMILSSQDPRAMRLYALAGFDAHPTVVAIGEVRPDLLPPTPVSPGGDDALDLVDELDRQARRGSRRPDVEHLLATGAGLLAHDDGRGYAVVGDDGPLMLTAEDEAAARDLLVAVLRQVGPGRGVEVRWLTARQQWAIRTGLRAGLRLHPAGPVMLRGLPHLPAPFLASGAFG